MRIIAMAQSADGGTAWDRIVSSLPSDPASLFVILLLVGSIGAVVWFGRKGGGGGDAE